MPDTDSHGRPIIVAAKWFGKLGAQPRKLKPGEQPTSQPATTAEPSPADEATDRSRRDV